MPTWCRVCVPLLLSCAIGCDDLSDFRTGDDVFRGEVIGGGSEVFQQGFAPGTFLELEFDPERAEGRGDGDGPPGYLHTYVCADGASTCDAPTPGPIERQPLEPFAILPHDVLSDYTFPGGDRLRNYILSVRRADVEGGSAMVFVSLMEAGGIEVRVMAPGAEPGEQGLFGVFRLVRVDR